MNELKLKMCEYAAGTTNPESPVIIICFILMVPIRGLYINSLNTTCSLNWPNADKYRLIFLYGN